MIKKMTKNKDFSIICWNVNGIRAFHKKGQFDWLLHRKHDVICLQEIKAEEGQLVDEISKPQGYKGYFESSKARKGYSGVAVYVSDETQNRVISRETTVGKKELDLEGRLMQIEFDDFFLINCYFPNGGGEPHRLEYKLAYYEAFLALITKLDKIKPVIFCGDLNVAHNEVDIARPKENEKHVGFLPIERAWVDSLIEAGFVDIYRELNPDGPKVYTWWDQKTRARDRGIGWRIDYFFCSKRILKHVNMANILDEIEGSDHCPIELIIKM